MAKMRIHELAKELGVASKEILAWLKEHKIEVQNHMSALADEDVEKVKKVFGKGALTKTAKPEEKAAENQKADTSEKPKMEEKAVVEAKTPKEQNEQEKEKKEEKEAAPKKKNITYVFHSQHSATGLKMPPRKPRPKPQPKPAPKAEKTEKPEKSEKVEKLEKPEELKKEPVKAEAETKAPQPMEKETVEKPVEQHAEKAEVKQEAPAKEETSPKKQDNRDKDGSRDTENHHDNRVKHNRDNRDNHAGQERSNRNQGGRNQGHSREFDQKGDRQDFKRENRNGRDNREGRDSRGGYRQDNRRNDGALNIARSLKDSVGSVQMAARPDKDSKREERERNQREKNREKHWDNGGRQGQKGQKNWDKLSREGRNHKNNKPAPAPKVEKKVEEVIREISIPESITIKELAERMKVQAAIVVKKLFLQGKVVNVNQEIDFATAEEVALEFNCIAVPEVKVDVIEELLKEEDEDESKMVKRPPVVCVMGHVDHGKTSLLDAIRNTHVIDREAGGITQHIGAYTVTANGEKITFLDTPGHEAFTAMRMRGANSTDIAILVVAADDGVMPQTIEAISHAKAAGIEIIVAINKIDKPSANIERVKQELMEYELVPEDWGGNTVFVPVSAHTHEGIDNLLEMINLTAEILELKANPKRNARGLVIEAELDKGRGPVATMLVQKGTLHVGDCVAAGSCYGKVRAMIDDKGRRVKEAGPSTPVEILGLNDVPNAGEIFVNTENEKEARSFAETFISEGREKMLEETKTKMSLDDLFSQIQAGNVKELNLIVKADVQGSVEAVKQSLLKLSNEEVVVKVIHAGVGAVNESDVSLASASSAIIIGFNVRPDASAKSVAETEGVDIRLYKVIYNAIEDVEAAMKGMLDPIFEEKILGNAEVRQTFKASGVGTIAGAYVLDGIFERGCSARIRREGELLFDGPLVSLKRFKDDVKEVKAGFECGLVFEKFNDIKEGDLVEAYTMVEVPR